MAKSLVFNFDGSDISFHMNKVDRSKLYGYKEQEVFDEQGRLCELATLADDGKTLVGKGGTGIGYLTADGNWSDKTLLKPVDLEGNPIMPVASSFAAPIELTDQTTIEDYLNHSARLIYQLELNEGAVGDKLITELKLGAIYKFDYSYRGGLEPDVGFLMTNETGELFLLICDATDINFIGLQLHRPLALDVDDPIEAEDLMDFGMI